ncbi:FMN-binding protein [Streptomyces sp. NBC_00873]|uniref:FMN-binding protein n=1 Tax=unclassified Streptomyces TaxID=2593676 RepID=UPI0038673A6F|nr:FMN-binding protein [Streptomyces sp. NBC_00873]WTA47859.1 FMN-binding protein [Streptomyces sp. NBC_00842]
MRRSVLVATGTSALVVALLSLKPHQPPGLPDAGRRPTTTVSPGTSTGAPPGAAKATGTFNGDPIDTRYGPVQVAVTLVKGKLTAVRTLRAPDENGRDREIATSALPRLTQEALGAQSAHIDSVSGASYTSQGYMESLQSALDRAGG